MPPEQPNESEKRDEPDSLSVRMFAFFETVNKSVDELAKDLIDAGERDVAIKVLTAGESLAVVLFDEGKF